MEENTSFKQPLAVVKQPKHSYEGRVWLYQNTQQTNFVICGRDFYKYSSSPL